jgi:hypothetical protein
MMASNAFFRKYSKPLQIIFLCAICFLIYAQSLQNGYIWDDDKYLYENEWVAYKGGLRDMWFSQKMPQYYPLVFSSFWAEHKIWGFKPFGYHLVNLILHILNAILVLKLVRRLNPALAFPVAILFAVHPVQVETVAWVTERKNLLSLLFFLLTTLSYIHYNDVKKVRYYVSSVAFFVCALLSKSVSVCFVAVPALYKWWKDGRVTAREILLTIPFFLLGLISAANTVYVELHRVGAKGVEWGLMFLERFILSGRIAFFYLYKLCLPFRFVFIYPRWTVDVTEPWQWIFTLAVIGLLAGLYGFRRSIGRGAFALFVFYLISVFPALGFINVFPMKFSFVADHFSYISTPVMLLFICSATAFFLYKGLKRAPVSKAGPYRVFGWIVFGLIIVYMCSKSMLLSRNYKNEITLWQDVIGKNRDAHIAYINLGAEYGAKGNEEEAIRMFRNAIETDPADANSYVNLTLAYTRSNQPVRVIIVGEKAISLGEDSALVHKRLAWSYYAVGDYAKAIEHCDQAQELGHKVQPELLEALEPHRKK